MNINGTHQSLEGKRFSEIGKLLQEASPARDGVGLRVELTGEEEAVFEQHFGMKIGFAICSVIADAVKAIGGNPQGFRYTYSNRVFKTTAV